MLHRADPGVARVVIGEGDKVPTAAPRGVLRWSPYVRMDDGQCFLAHIPFAQEWVSVLFAQHARLTYSSWFSRRELWQSAHYSVGLHGPKFFEVYVANSFVPLLYVGIVLESLRVHHGIYLCCIEDKHLTFCLTTHNKSPVSSMKQLSRLN